jgi:hypothetical protein
LFLVGDINLIEPSFQIDRMGHHFFIRRSGGIAIRGKRRQSTSLIHLADKRNYMNPSTKWAEIINEGEVEKLEKYAEAIHAIQKKNAEKGSAGRALHHKGLLGVKAEFTVLDTLPDYAKVGIFAAPKTFPAYVRFSNGGPTSGDDRQPDQRAVAVKVLQVPGKKIIHGLENAPTQDFLMIRDPALPFKNADEFVPFITLIAAPMGLLKILFKVGLFRTLAIIKRVKSAPKIPMISLATIKYFSASPIKFGAYAAHYTLKPRSVDGPGSQPGDTPNYLGEELAERLKSGTVIYDFGVQFFIDENRTPIEDASVEWKEDMATFIALARLTLTQQDPDSAPGRKLHEFIEKLSFDPWHAPEEFRPLGNMMRARRAAYKASVKERQALPEPDGTEKFE